MCNTYVSDLEKNLSQHSGPGTAVRVFHEAGYRSEFQSAVESELQVESTCATVTLLWSWADPAGGLCSEPRARARDSAAEPPPERWGPGRSSGRC
jgi:hypothetical protein